MLTQAGKQQLLQFTEFAFKKSTMTFCGLQLPQWVFFLLLLHAKGLNVEQIKIFEFLSSFSLKRLSLRCPQENFPSMKEQPICAKDSPLALINELTERFCSIILSIELFITSSTHVLQYDLALHSTSKVPALEIDLATGHATPQNPSAKPQVTLIHGPTPSSKPDLCDGQAVVRLDFSGTYKKAKIELIYGREPRLWTVTISDTEMTYGFGANHDYSSNCASVQVYNRQFRIYTNKLQGYLSHSMNGNNLMQVRDDVVEKGTNMTIDVSDETVTWKTQSLNSTKTKKEKNPYLFTLSGQASTYGPPADTFLYAGFNRVPHGSFHNGSGLCKVRITFRKDLGKGKGTLPSMHAFPPQ